ENNASNTRRQRRRGYEGGWKKNTTTRHNREDRRQARCRSLLRDVPVPREIFDSNSAGTEEMMRIKSLCDLIRMPVPDRRGQNGDGGERRQLQRRSVSAVIKERAISSSLRRF